MERVLVAQTGFLGDLVLTTPLLRALRALPLLESVSLLCTPQGAELLRNSPLVDRLIVFDKRGRDRGWASFLRLAGHLRDSGFTHALAPHRSLTTALLLAAARIPFRVGFRESPAWFLYHFTVRRDPLRHGAERILALAANLDGGHASQSGGLWLSAPAENQTRVDLLLQKLGISLEEPLFGIHPGSVWATKRWHTSGYAEVAACVRQHYGGRVLVLGRMEDRVLAATIIKLTAGEAIDLTGATNLGDLLALLSRLRILVTNDSGPMHMAVAMGTPVVAVFCSTTRDLGFYPYTHRAVVVEKELSCRPCGPHGGHRCPIGTEECIRGIGPEDVLRAIRLLLERRDTGNDGRIPFVVSV